MSGEIDGTITRQLLPFGHARRAQSPGMRAEIRKAYRWVTWAVQPVTLGQARAHLITGGEGACVVQVLRGPRGGWIEAAFRVGIPDVIKFKVGTTFHFAWLHLDNAAHPKDTMRPIEQWRAHLELHSPT